MPPVSDFIIDKADGPLWRWLLWWGAALGVFVVAMWLVFGI